MKQIIIMQQNKNRYVLNYVIASASVQHTCSLISHARYFICFRVNLPCDSTLSVDYKLHACVKCLLKYTCGVCLFVVLSQIRFELLSLLKLIQSNCKTGTMSFKKHYTVYFLEITSLCNLFADLKLPCKDSSASL